MSEYSITSTARRSVVVDVYLLLITDDRIVLRKRANTGYGDGAYEPPSGQLAGRETIVETAIRVARAADLAVDADNLSLAHVMHDVSGGGRIAFFLAVPGWPGEPAAGSAAGPAGDRAGDRAGDQAGPQWFPLTGLPTNMLDRARVALRNYAEGLRFSTYPDFAHLAS